MGGMDEQPAPAGSAEGPGNTSQGLDRGVAEDRNERVPVADMDGQLPVSGNDGNGNEGNGHDDNGNDDSGNDEASNHEEPENEGSDEDQDHEAHEDGESEDDPTAHFAWVNRMDAVEETNECPACSSIVSADEIVYLACGHPWCKDCLNNNIRAALTQRSTWPPHCCEYTRDDGINVMSIQSHLDDDVLLRMFEVGEEFMSKNPVFCFDPKCSEFIPDPEKGKSEERGQWATCLHCYKVTCVQCKGAKDLHPTPDEHPDIFTKENRDLSDQQGWKQCPNPNCHHIIEKLDGCDHMECDCGTHFCYRCGRPLEEAGGEIDGLACNCSGQNPWVEQLQQDEDPDAPHDSDDDREEDSESNEDLANEGLANGDRLPRGVNFINLALNGNLMDDIPAEGAEDTQHIEHAGGER